MCTAYRSKRARERGADSFRGSRSDRTLEKRDRDGAWIEKESRPTTERDGSIRRKRCGRKGAGRRGRGGGEGGKRRLAGSREREKGRERQPWGVRGRRTRWVHIYLYICMFLRPPRPPDPVLALRDSIRPTPLPPQPSRASSRASLSPSIARAARAWRFTLNAGPLPPVPQRRARTRVCRGASVVDAAIPVKAG